MGLASRSALGSVTGPSPRPLVPVSPCPPQPVRVPAAAWRTPLEAKQTVLLPFLRPGRPPRLVPTMTSKKYPVGSFTDPRLQVQVPAGTRCWRRGQALTSLQWHWGGAGL